VDSAFGAWRRSYPAIVLAAITLLIHLVVNGRYGVYSDELYFMVCGQHPAMGYVDQPPLVPLIAGLSHALFGTALLPLRLIPALAMTATVALTAEFARTLGGGRFAQWLAGLTVLFGGDFLVDGLLLLTDMMQPLTWLGCGWCLLRVAQTRDERWWLAFGAIAGFSLLSKYLILFFLAGLAFGVIATPLRRSFAHRGVYLGAVIALVIASPSVVWQAMHGWPFLELGQTAINGKNLALTPLEFRLLSTLLVRRGRVQTRETLLSDVWGITADVETRTVDTHVKRLREKLGPAGAYLETLRGVGYRFAEKPVDTAREVS